MRKILIKLESERVSAETKRAIEEIFPLVKSCESAYGKTVEMTAVEKRCFLKKER